MYLIVDIQGFRGARREFVPKEICLISIYVCGDEPKISDHWIIQEPYDKRKLSCKECRENTWLTKNHHGMLWRQGGTPWSEVLQHLCAAAALSDRILVRGKIKADFLEKILGREIINLEEDDDFPSFDDLPSNVPVCCLHSTRGWDPKYAIKRCALSQAHQIVEFITKYSSAEDLYSL